MLNNFLLKFKKIFLRFPVSIFFIFFIIYSLSYVINYWPDIDMFLLGDNKKFVITAFLTILLSIWIDLLRERYNKSSWLHVISLFFFCIYFISFRDYYWNDIEFVYRINLALIWILSFIFVSPYLFKSDNSSNNYPKYLYKISKLFSFTTIFWIGLLFSWWIIIALSNVIFWLEYNINIFRYWWILSIIIITPLFLLYNLPKKDEYHNLSIKTNWIYELVLKYLFIPFIILYSISIYLYSIKILVNITNLPSWEIIWKVVSYLTIGFIIYIYSSLQEKNNKIVKIFRDLFPYFAIPQLFLLFAAISLRIYQHDLTINRYLVVVFWIWLLIVSLYLIINKKKELKFIPYSLMVISIIISVWPWWVYNLPEDRQQDRLNINLTEAKILVNWKIIPLPHYEFISEELSNEIYWWIEYLCKHFNCYYINETLFVEQYREVFEKEYRKLSHKNIENSEWGYTWPSNEDIVDGIAKIIKIKKFDEYQSNIINHNEKHLIVRIFNKIRNIYLELTDVYYIKSREDVYYEENNSQEKYNSPEPIKSKIIVDEEIMSTYYKNNWNLWEDLRIARQFFIKWSYEISISNYELIRRRWYEDTEIIHNLFLAYTYIWKYEKAMEYYLRFLPKVWFKEEYIWKKIDPIDIKDKLQKKGVNIDLNSKVDSDLLIEYATLLFEAWEEYYEIDRVKYNYAIIFHNISAYLILDQALIHQPENPEIYYKQWVIILDIVAKWKYNENAQKKLKKAVELDNDNFLYHYKLWNAYMDWWKNIEARRSFLKWIELNNNFEKLYLNLSVVNYDLWEKEEWHKNNIKWLEICTNMCHAFYLNMWNELYREKMYDEAKEYYKKALAIKPDLKTALEMIDVIEKKLDSK